MPSALDTALPSPSLASIVIPSTLESFIEQCQPVCPPLLHPLACMLYPMAKTARLSGLVQAHTPTSHALLCFTLTDSGFLVICSSHESDCSPHFDEALRALLRHLRTQRTLISRIFGAPGLRAVLEAVTDEGIAQVEPYLSCVGLQAPALADKPMLPQDMRWRVCGEGDTQLLRDWMQAFNVELQLVTPDLDGLVMKLVREQTAFLLCSGAPDNQAVALCCAQGDCQVSADVRLSRITALYTPPELRGQGQGPGARQGIGVADTVASPTSAGGQRRSIICGRPQRQDPKVLCRRRLQGAGRWTGL